MLTLFCYFHQTELYHGKKKKLPENKRKTYQTSINKEKGWAVLFNGRSSYRSGAYFSCQAFSPSH